MRVNTFSYPIYIVPLVTLLCVILVLLPSTDLLDKIVLSMHSINAFIAIQYTKNFNLVSFGFPGH